MLVAHSGAMYDKSGQRVATFVGENHGAGDAAQTQGERSILEGDFDGDGRKDVMLATPQGVHIYRNANGKKVVGETRLGTEPNFTLY
jgi:filamentous hemagglutinin family protein